MSKSYGNAIQLTDAPNEVFGKTMSIADEAMEPWYTLLTRLDPPAIARLLAGHPREAKARLAWELVAFVHGRAAADAARGAFDRQFVAKELPDEIPEKVFAGAWSGDGMPLAVLLREVGLVTSGAEARRLIGQGGVRVDGEVVSDPAALVVPPAESLLLQVGKRRYARVRRG
jgi:tyrosyl-tRNA synthetase